MISKIFTLMCLMSSSVFGQNTPSPDVLSVMNLASTLNFVNLFDGPASVSNAPTIPTTNTPATLDEMEYYNYYAAAMYCQYQLKDLSCNACQYFKDDVFDKTVIMNNNSDTTALVTISLTRQEIVVSFRGTSNIWNAVLDVTTIACTYPNLPEGIKLHAGFHTAIMSLYDEVVINVGYLHNKFPDFKIVIVGHSLGAAMARMTQFYFLALNQFPGATYVCITYGEPRSGNQPYAKYMNAQNITTARVVFNGDIVPHVPPTSLLGTTALGDYYVHVQTEYWYVDENKQRYCDTSVYEDPTCSASVGPAYSVVDHGTYLGYPYIICFVGQPFQLAAIPLSILQPVGTIPPFPTFIANFIGGAANFLIVSVLGPILGG